MVYAPRLISRRVDSFVAAHVPRYQGRSRLQAYLSTFQCPPTTFIDTVICSQRMRGSSMRIQKSSLYL